MSQPEQTPIVDHLSDDLMVTYRPDYDDVSIEGSAFVITLEREDFEALKKFLEKLPSELE